MKKWQALGSAAALLAALLLGGCSGQQAAATPEQAATPSPAATAEPTPVPAPAGNPLTGLDDADYTGKRPAKAKAMVWKVMPDDATRALAELPTSAPAGQVSTRTR